MAKFRLTSKDVHSVQKQVLGQLKRDGDHHVLAVGMGIKNAHRRRGRRRFAVILVVKRRVPPHRLPKKIRMGKGRHVIVNVGRGTARRGLRLPTDVVELRRAVPVSAVTGSGNEIGSSGALIFWTIGAAEHWGLLTASHVVDPSDSTVVITPAVGPDVFGSVEFQTKSGDGYDAAVIRLDTADVPTLVPGVQLSDPPALQVRDFAMLIEDIKADKDRGLCFTPEKIVKFDIDLALPGPIDLITGWPGMLTLLKVRALAGSGSKPFHKGASGSPWMHFQQNMPTAILVAAEAPQFTVGIGQALEPLLKRVATELGTNDLRLVRVF